MKLAPLSASVAVLLLIFGIAISKPTISDTKVLPLDFSGIDTMRVVDWRDSATIKISDQAPAQASYKDLKQNGITVSRSGNSMTVHTNLLDLGGLDLVVPSKVRTFVIGVATIRSEAILDQVLVRTSGGITWAGDIRELRIEAGPPRRKCKKDCGVRVHVNEGNITRLEVRTPGGTVSFQHPDTVAAAVLYLGPHGKVSLSDATRLGNIVLRDTAAPVAEE